jgi:hypothetical protein
MLKPIEYLDKGTDFSASDFTQPDYYLWIKKRNNVVKNEEKDEVFSPSFVGSLIHQNHESLNEVNVIKEFSTIKKINGYTVGGTIDRLEMYPNGYLTICDLKSGGQYPMLKKFKDGSDDWITQLSVYKWLIDDLFKVEEYGKIYAFVLGHQKNKDNMPMTWSTTFELDKHIDNLMCSKIETAVSDTPPENDCPKWKCCNQYCDYYTYCQTRNIEPKAFS